MAVAMLWAMDARTAYERRAAIAFLDVREPHEWAAGHVEGSTNVPIGEIAARVGELDADATTVVVCQVGQRSALVSAFLADAGLDAHNLEGGLEAWVARGLPLVAPNLDRGTVVDGWARDLSGRRLHRS
jgi:rhodanese-related sulfurtransferase